MSGEMERKKFVVDPEKAGQQIVHLETETREEGGEQALLAAEFRKVASQLGELRRREIHLLRRVALLEAERRQEQASFEAQSAESNRLNAELSEARCRLTELDRALEAQARQLELKRRQGDARRKRTEDLEAALESRSAEVISLKESTSWRFTRPLRWFAEGFPRSARQLKRISQLFSERNTFQPSSRFRYEDARLNAAPEGRRPAIPSSERPLSNVAEKEDLGLERHLHIAPNKQATDIGELPPVSDSASGPAKWDLIDGLNAKPVEELAVVSSQRILRLIAVGDDCRHALSARFSGLAPDRNYRISTWVKGELGARVMIEVRDSVDPLTGTASNYGVAQFNLADRSVFKSTGDILASGADAAENDWVKLWVDLRSKDGQIIILLGLLEGINNKHIFRGNGQEVFFGGFEISSGN
jgi:hypothetical protein